MTNNSIVRVTKAQKLKAIRDSIPENFTTLFSGTDSRAEYIFDHDEAVSFIDSLLDALAKKNSKSGELSPDQKKNETYKQDILNYLQDKPEGAICTDMFKGIPSLFAFSVQKVSALANQLVNDGLLITEKGKKGATIFKLA